MHADPAGKRMPLSHAGRDARSRREVIRWGAPQSGRQLSPPDANFRHSGWGTRSLSPDGMRTDRVGPQWALGPVHGLPVLVSNKRTAREAEMRPGVRHPAQSPNTSMAGEGGKVDETERNSGERGTTPDPEPSQGFDETFPLRLGKKVTVGGFPMRLWGPC